jgi:hypothetical protein
MNDAPQRSPEWFAARCGSLGGSKVGSALAVLKRGGGRTKASTDLLFELAAERITGQPARRVNALQWGVDHEDEAIATYAFLTNAEITRPGIIPHPRIAGAHVSIDALVGDDGGCEVKCPTSSVHLQTLMGAAIPEDHLPQVVWSLACTGRAWIDFISYDPRFPEGLQFFVKRLERDEAAIAAMEAEVEAFLAELDGKLRALGERYAWEKETT